MSSNTVKVQVDLSLDADESLHTEVAHINAMSSSVKCVVVREHGPAGGAAIVELSGPRTAVQLLLHDYWHMNAEDIADLVYGKPALDDFMRRIQPKENVFSHYKAFKIVRVTTDKLEATLNECEADLMLLNEGDCSPVDFWEPIQVTFTGGRDWVILAGNVGP